MPRFPLIMKNHFIQLVCLSLSYNKVKQKHIELFSTFILFFPGAEIILVKNE